MHWLFHVEESQIVSWLIQHLGQLYFVKFDQVMSNGMEYKLYNQ